MKVAIIGSTQYLSRMQEHADILTYKGHQVKLPALDSIKGDELAICSYNRSIIEWADEVHVFWDQRSLGTIFDLGMAFALRKPIKVIYLEKKTFANFMRQYQSSLEHDESSLEHDVVVRMGPKRVEQLKLKFVEERDEDR